MCIYIYICTRPFNVHTISGNLIINYTHYPGGLRGAPRDGHRPPVERAAGLPELRCADTNELEARHGSRHITYIYIYIYIYIHTYIYIYIYIQSYWRILIRQTACLCETNYYLNTEGHSIACVNYS